MARIIAYYVSTEMALLGLFELILSFALIDLMLASQGPSTLMPSVMLASGGSLNLAAMLTITIGVAAATIGLYRPEALIDRNSLLISALVAGVVAFPVGLVIIDGAGFGISLQDVFWLLTVLGAWLVCIFLTRLAVRGVLGRTRLARRVLVVGEGERAQRPFDTLDGGRFRRFEPVQAGVDPDRLSLEMLREHRIWAVILAQPVGLEAVLAPLLDNRHNGIRVVDDAGFHERHLGRIDLDTIGSHWLTDTRASRPSAMAKRAFDVVVSLLLLLLTAPLMAATALLIKLESRGPVFYRQQRAGLHGAPFTVLKFRSMSVDAEAGGKPRWAQKQDPRITRMGRFIRPMRIDELPQLLNVLSGEMSMIGPRPERPHFVEQLAEVIPFYGERSCVKPGLTGWAQVNFPYGASVEDAREKLAYDLYYVKNRSMLLDLLILLSTVRVVLFREGAR